MHLSAKTEGKLKTRRKKTLHLRFMTESVLVQKAPGERVVMDAALKAAISPSIRQITVSLCNPLWRQSQTVSTPVTFFIVSAFWGIHIYITALQESSHCLWCSRVVTVRILSQLLEAHQLSEEQDWIWIIGNGIKLFFTETPKCGCTILDCLCSVYVCVCVCMCRMCVGEGIRRVLAGR